MSTHYHTGQNIPGYMPMADETYSIETFAAAKADMIDMLDRAGDAIFDGGQDEDERAVADEYSAAMEDLNLDSGPTWDAYLPASTSEHDLGLHFWIIECNEAECDEHDTY